MLFFCLLEILKKYWIEVIREQFDFYADFEQFLRHYSTAFQPFGLKVVLEIDYEMDSYLRSFLIQNIVFRKNIHVWSFYILIMYLWYKDEYQYFKEKYL
jgi:hypothetical protein